MNKSKKNIVLVGFTDTQINSIGVPEIAKVITLDNLEDIKKHQGYLVIINNKDNIKLVDFDKKYRKYLNKYIEVWLYNEKYSTYRDKFSNIELVYNYIFEGMCSNIYDEWERYKDKLEHSKQKTYSKKRMEKIELFYNYLKDYKTIKTDKICSDLNVNPRMVQRYMFDVNKKYHNIGYDYSNNEWYITKL